MVPLLPIGQGDDSLLGDNPMKPKYEIVQYELVGTNWIESQYKVCSDKEQAMRESDELNDNSPTEFTYLFRPVKVAA